MAPAVLIAAAFFVASSSRAGSPQSGVPVLVEKAMQGCFSSAVRFTGLVVPRAEAIVNLDVTGYQISALLVAEGDSVTAGQVLARLSPLTGGPAEGPSAPTGTAQQAGNSALRAPAAGVIRRVGAKVGDVAAAVPLPPPLGPEPAFSIIVGNELEVEADVLSLHLAEVKVGQLARIRLDSGRELAGRVRTILPEIDRKTQLGKVRLAIDSDPITRAGLFAQGSIDASHSCGVSIPRSSVQYESGGTTVQVVHNSVVEARQIKTGLFSDDKIEVREGVKEGELIIANAGSSLHNGDRVKPMLADDRGQ